MTDGEQVELDPIERMQMHTRIRAAAEHAAQCYEAWQLAVKARDELIVIAFEADKSEGHNRKNSERTLARWARLSQSRVHGIIAAA